MPGTYNAPLVGVAWLRTDWLTPAIQRQSAVPATSISFGRRRRG